MKRWLSLIEEIKGGGGVMVNIGGGLGIAGIWPDAILGIEVLT